MKALIVALIGIFFAQLAHAQCSSPSKLTASLTEYVDVNGIVQRTVTEKSSIEISKTEVIISAGDQPKMTAVIKSDSCNWKTAYKEGKSVITTNFTRNGSEATAVLTIEGKDNKVTLLIEFPDRPDRKIRVTADTWEAKI